MNIIYEDQERECPLLVVSLPPSKRIINCSLNRAKDEYYYENDGLENGRNRLFLSFPEILFSIEHFNTQQTDNTFFFRTLAVAFADKDNLYYPNFLNVNPSLKVCTNSNVFSLDRENFVKKTIANFWETEFNFSYGATYLNMYRIFDNSRIRNFKVWQENTKNNPLWIPDENDMVIVPESPYRQDRFGR